MEVQEIDYHDIKNQFEVKPTYEVLAKRRFLPMPKHLKLELARQKEAEAKIAEEKAEKEKAFEDEV
jgi:hypothetical protein